VSCSLADKKTAPPAKKRKIEGAEPSGSNYAPAPGTYTLPTHTYDAELGRASFIMAASQSEQLRKAEDRMDFKWGALKNETSKVIDGLMKRVRELEKKEEAREAERVAMQKALEEQSSVGEPEEQGGSGAAVGE
jgi:hypothetical protein